MIPDHGGCDTRRSRRSSSLSVFSVSALTPWFALAYFALVPIASAHEIGTTHVSARVEEWERCPTGERPLNTLKRKSQQIANARIISFFARDIARISRA